MKEYEPRGLIVPFIKAVKAEPERVWTVADAIRITGQRSNKLGGSLTYALRHRIIYRGKRDGLTVYLGVPFPEGNVDPPPLKERYERRIRKSAGNGWITTEDDIRVPKVVQGWTPPQMVAPRSA